MTDTPDLEPMPDEPRPPRTWRKVDASFVERETLPQHPFAQLYYDWDELDVLAGLVDAELALSEHTWSTGDEHWSMLNALRTSLREAQYGLRRSADIVLPPQPHKLVCPVCNLTRTLPDGWQQILGSETLMCTQDQVPMVEAST